MQMIENDSYEKLLKKYWDVASWTIWTQPDVLPKSNMGDLSAFDDPNLLDYLNNKYVFVALNGSGRHEGYFDPNRAWHNFHSDNPRGNDYKLRYALNGTPFWGSYLTDIIKYFEEVDSNKVIKYVRANPAIMQKNIRAFNEELSLLGGKPIIIALGDASYNLIKEYYKGDNEVTKIKHYSYTIGKEKYREEVLATLSKYM